jgi:hypothetical protein
VIARVHAAGDALGERLRFLRRHRWVMLAHDSRFLSAR